MGIKCFDKAIGMNPNDAEAWASKAMPLYRLRRYDEAKKCLRKAEDLGFPQAQRMLKHLERAGH